MAVVLVTCVFSVLLPNNACFREFKMCPENVTQLKLCFLGHSIALPKNEPHNVLPVSKMHCLSTTQKDVANSFVDH